MLRDRQRGKIGKRRRSGKRERITGENPGESLRCLRESPRERTLDAPEVRNLAAGVSYPRIGVFIPVLLRDRIMENILIPLFVFSFIYLTIKMILDYNKSKMERTSAEANRSLAMGELKTLIREAVEEAQAPLLARLEALEGRRPELPPAERAPLLEPPEPEATVEASPVPPPVRRTRRRPG